MKHLANGAFGEENEFGSIAHWLNYMSGDNVAMAIGGLLLLLLLLQLL